MRIVARCIFSGALAAGCASSGTGAPSDAGYLDLGAPPPPYVDAGEEDADKPMVDGGYVTPDGGVERADRFITKVVSFTPGTCAGFGAAKMPGIVLGPPVGAGDLEGSL